MPRPFGLLPHIRYAIGTPSTTVTRSVTGAESARVNHAGGTAASVSAFKIMASSQSDAVTARRGAPRGVRPGVPGLAGRDLQQPLLGGRLAWQPFRGWPQPGEDERDVAVRQVRRATLPGVGDSAKHLDDRREVG